MGRKGRRLPLPISARSLLPGIEAEDRLAPIAHFPADGRARRASGPSCPPRLGMHRRAPCSPRRRSGCSRPPRYPRRGAGRQTPTPSGSLDVGPGLCGLCRLVRPARLTFRRSMIVYIASPFPMRRSSSPTATRVSLRRRLVAGQQFAQRPRRRLVQVDARHVGELPLEPDIERRPRLANMPSALPKSALSM